MIQSIREWCPQTRYLIVLVGWFALFWLPTLAGDWYGLHFHVYQSLTSLIVIGMARGLFPKAAWADYLGIVAMIQIVHAVGDYFSPEPPWIYNAIQGAFNGFELIFLLSGGMTEWVNGRSSPHRNRNSRPDSSDREKRNIHA